MKRKTPVKLIGYLLCVALLCGLLAGCGNDKVQEEQNDNVSADTIPEDVVVHTDYLHKQGSPDYLDSLLVFLININGIPSIKSQ